MIRLLALIGLDANGDPDPTKEKLLDVDSLISYLLVTHYMAASDNAISWFVGRYARINNMYASYNRVNPDGFKWFHHDSEHSLDTNRALDWTGPFTNSNFLQLQYFNPMTLHDKLIANEEYRMKFNDIAYKYLENGGVLTLAKSQARLDYRAAQIDRAIVANAARWGSTSRDRDTWVNAVATTRAWLARSGDRCIEVIDYLENDGLIPSVKPPVLSQSSGLVTTGTMISLSEPTPVAPVASAPYPSGVAHTISNTERTIIQAEDFDTGGSGVAYYDTSSGNGWDVFRTTEDVDIENCSDVGGGYNIGSTDPDEWLNYTVDVASAGDYEIIIRVAIRNTDSDASAYYIEVDGTDATGLVSFDGTGGWQNWVDQTSTVGLAAGEQVITLQLQGDANINYIEFVPLNTSSLTPATGTPSTPNASTVYYTIDGTDPRAIGGAITGTAYSRPISITRPTHLKARSLTTTGEWSALAEGTYWTDEIPLVVTELMYHSPDGDAHDFVEVQNISDETITLKGYKLDNAIDFKFKNAAQSTLAPGDYLVVIDDIDAFNESYPDSSATIAGEFGENFSNGGEEVDLEFRNNDLISFSYDDARDWPQAADGAGHSLVPLDRAMDTQESGSLDYGGNWRGSSYAGGSPGEADPELPTTIVINEVWAHTDTNLAPPNDSNDAIELYNSSDASVLISGWYLSDSLNDTQKWLIPDIVIPGGGFVIYDETDFNPNGVSGFGLNKAGEQVVLSAPGRIVDVVRFKGQENADTGVTWGRYPDGIGQWMMTAPTEASPNQPLAPTVRISEVMYNPTQPGNDYEYILIENVGTGTHSFQNTTGTYRIDGGVDFAFPTGISLNAGERLWILSFDPIDTARLNLFAAAYGLKLANETFIGGYSGSLSDRAERVALERPQDSDDPLNPLDISWVVVDELFYFNQSPWPSGADGTGYPLLRTGTTTWGAPTAGDADADRIPDRWEFSYFSSDIAPGDDPDGDGQDNFDEFVAGTNPTDQNSYFKIQNLTARTLQWNSNNGRTYTIYRTDDLSQPFEEIAVSGSPFIDTAVHDNQPTYFYKVKAELDE
ncbi:lamin tail domain-containing protein [bacterium]|nr:lamin tail domain-containing protein [bacterium]